MGISKFKRGALAYGLTTALLATTFGGGMAYAQESRTDKNYFGFSLETPNGDPREQTFLFVHKETPENRIVEDGYREIPLSQRPKAIDEVSPQLNRENPPKVKFDPSDTPTEKFNNLTYCFNQPRHRPNTLAWIEDPNSHQGVSTLYDPAYGADRYSAPTGPG